METLTFHRRAVGRPTFPMNADSRVSLSPSLPRFLSLFLSRLIDPTTLPRTSLLFGRRIPPRLARWSFGSNVNLNRALSRFTRVESSHEPLLRLSRTSRHPSWRRSSPPFVTWCTSLTDTHGVTVVAQLTRRGRRHNGTNARTGKPGTHASFRDARISLLAEVQERERMRRTHASAR